MADEIIDTVARNSALRANERLSEHQVACGREYARIDHDLKAVLKGISDLDAKTVSNDRFRAVELIAYGLVGLLMIGVVTALLQGILK